jgi:hypothetical protein
MSTKKNQKIATTNVSTAPSTSYAIQDNVPMPVRTARGQASRFPFDVLKPTQSFMVTLEAEGLADIDKLAARMRSAIYSASKRTGNKFVSEVNEKAGIVTIRRAATPKA